MSTIWFVVARLARDRSALIGLLLIGLLVAAALLAPVLSTHPDDVFELHPSERLRAPSGTHWLGTDRMGADVYSRLLFGARITILIGLIAVGASLLIGVPIGLVAGYYHGWASDALMRVSDIFLAVPQVVLAFILVWPFGIGPLAGILAIGIHSAGALGKLFSELVENADMRPMEGMRSAGGNWLECVRYGIVPQVLPGFLSYALLRFEINVRSSTIIGFVGAGGIGQEFKRVIGFNIYEEVSAIAILILTGYARIPPVRSTRE